ncbi:MAG: formyltransferase family protein [Fibrobacterota bacterium]
MNIAIITEEDVFYVREFFREFFALSQHADYTLKGITILPAFNKKSPFALARQMLGFYGPFHFVRVGMQYVWRKMTGKTIAALAESCGVALHQTDDVNTEEYRAWLRENAIDLVISVAAPVLFRKELLETPALGCINSHSALLPENRGMMPVFWGMYKKSPEIGVTIHTMEAQLDRGEILTQERVPVRDESLHEMILKTKRISARLMDRTIRDFQEDRITRRPISGEGSYQSFPTPAQVREFRRRGGRLF